MIKRGFDQTKKDGVGRTPRDCAEDHSDVLGLFESVAKSTSLKPEVRAVIQEAALAATDNEVRIVETPRLPFMTLIKAQHEELQIGRAHV